MKTNKSYSKRLKTTTTGKVLARRPGTNHFRAKQSRVKQLSAKRLKKFRISRKQASLFLPRIKIIN